jgi:HSP20 family protein
MRITTDPTRELALLQRDVTSMFDQFLGARATQPHRWVPPLDVVELDDTYTVTLDLPGMLDDDIAIELEDRVLRISGERRDHRSVQGEGVRRIERSFGAFERTLTLPRGVDADAIAATFEHGVLEVTVPKPVAIRPRRIDISTGSRSIEGGSVTETERELAHA